MDLAKFLLFVTEIPHLIACKFRRHGVQSRRALFGVLFIGTGIYFTSLPHITIADSSPKCHDEVISLKASPLNPASANVSHTISNCSLASKEAVANVLANSDAYLEGRLRFGDRFFVNKEFVAWVDTQAAPGILRGLWPVDEQANFKGVTEPTSIVGRNANKSMIAIHQGYLSTTAFRGYKGLHVEIHRNFYGLYQPTDSTPQPIEIWSYRNQAYDKPNQFEVRDDYSQATYTTELKNLCPGVVDFTTCQSKDATPFVGYNGISTKLWLTITYKFTPDTFFVVTRLSADAPVNFMGDAGQLLLITNPACRMDPDYTTGKPYATDLNPQRFAPCSPEAVATRSLRYIQYTPGANEVIHPNIRTVNATTKDMYGDNDSWYDISKNSQGVITGKNLKLWEDRTFGQTFNSGVEAPTTGTPMILSYGSSNKSFLSVIPRWNNKDTARQTTNRIVAYHYNADPHSLNGISGLGSLDVVFQPSPCRPPEHILANGVKCDLSNYSSLAIGGNRGSLDTSVQIDGQTTW